MITGNSLIVTVSIFVISTDRTKLPINSARSSPGCTSHTSTMESQILRGMICSQNLDTRLRTAGASRRAREFP